MAVQILLRRGSSAQWASSNPILAQGEAGVELDTGNIKIGDGVTHWNSLPYTTVSQTTAQSLIDSSIDAHEALSDPHPQYETSAEAQAKVDSHANRTDNPHSVTKSQVGLGNVSNLAPADLPVSTATQTALDGKVDGNAAITGATKTKITYDSKGLVTSGSNAVLGDLADVDSSAPALDDLLRWNGSKWAPGPRSTINAGSGVDLFFSTVASGISSYDTLQKVPDSTSLAVDEYVDVTSADGELLIDEYISEELGDTSIDAGVWQIDSYAYVSIQDGVSKLHFEFYSRTSGGVETLLFEFNSGHIDDLSQALYQISTTQPAFVVNTTDRLVVKVKASTTNASTVRVHFVHSGSTPTHITTPLVTHHNDLSQLQGGSNNEYYHLTATEYTGVGSGAFVRSSSLASYVPTSRTVNGHALSADISVTKGDVGLGSVDNVSAASLRDRSTHTGFQTASTISDFQEAAQDAVASGLTDTATIGWTYSDATDEISADIFDGSITDSKLASGINANKIDGGSVTNSEFSTLAGISTATSIQTQIDSKDVAVLIYQLAGATGHVHTAVLTVDEARGLMGGSLASVVKTSSSAGVTPHTHSTTITWDATTAQFAVSVALAAGHVHDSTVQQLSKLRQIYILSAQATNSTTTYTTIAGLTTVSLPVGLYSFKFDGLYQSAATTTGVGVRISNVTATVTTCFGKWLLGQAADGVNKNFQIDQTSTTTNVVSASSNAANTNACVYGGGIFRVTVAGTVAIQLRSEIAASQVLIQPDAVFVIEAI